MSFLRHLIILAPLGLVGCGDDSSGSGSESDSQTSTSMGTASEGPTGTGSASGTNGDPPANCGWNGNSYTCGFEGPDPEGLPVACSPDVEPGGMCSAQTDSSGCCDADGNALVCVCNGNACDYHWEVRDCAHGPGAGACGWWPEGMSYTCGGDGEDPNGTPMACPREIEVGQPCIDSEVPPPCCDANGDAWTCYVDPNGGGDQWQSTEC